MHDSGVHTLSQMDTFGQTYNEQRLDLFFSLGRLCSVPNLAWISIYRCRLGLKTGLCLADTPEQNCRPRIKTLPNCEASHCAQVKRPSDFVWDTIEVGNVY
jgi:hypothetical protein